MCRELTIGIIDKIVIEDDLVTRYKIIIGIGLQRNRGVARRTARSRCRATAGRSGTGCVATRRFGRIWFSPLVLFLKRPFMAPSVLLRLLLIPPDTSLLTWSLAL